MAITRKSQAAWEGDLKGGKGHIKFGSGVYEGPYSFGTRFGDAPGTNPEELIAAAHSACFSMAFANILASAGHVAKRVDTRAEVTLDKVGEGFQITGILLKCQASVPGLDDKTFQELGAKAKAGCPISIALSATPIHLEATLVA